ncbi:MAG: capsule assembly Wzi family protein [Dysgonamonadaceae bacterium]|jgi:hypothetical protein|nr:capsule assembly Wzi family protein [Dysgonamonadaceae bacterium]
MKKLSGIWIICLFFVQSYGQTGTTYRAETFGSAAGGEHTPFWMTNHNWGMVDLTAGNFYVRGGVFHEQVINKDWSWDAGIDLAGGAPSVYGKVWVQQLYGRLHWKAWRLDIGAREDYVSFLDEHLSSGDMSMSNHARPVPEVKISLPDFIPVPRTKGVLYFKGDFALGKYLDGKWQENTAQPYNLPYTTDVLSHHKAVFFRFGNMEKLNKMQFTLGFSHYAQWGGILYERINDHPYVVVDQPQNLNELLRVLFAQKGSENSSFADKANVAGSHWGSYLVNLDYKLNVSSHLQFYFLHFFEDGSSMNPRSFKDMMLGVHYQSKERQLISGALFEYLYTKDQSGSIHFVLQDDDHADLRTKETGNDDYYHNVDYLQGPSYFGRSFGTPLFLAPGYNTDGRLNFKNNRIIALHWGLEGYLHPTLQYRLLLTTGQGWGRYFRPFLTVHNGFASQLELTYTFPKASGWEARWAIGYDRGAFFGGDTFGAGITLVKKGAICSKQERRPTGY